MRPPVHAQSAGDQKRSPSRGNLSCEYSKPGRLPISAACGINAPFGEPVVPQGAEYFNKPAKIGKPTPAHQDGYYFKLKPNHAVTLWLALESVDAENGCVRYVQGSHRHGLRAHGRSGVLGFSQGMLDFPQPDGPIRDVTLLSYRGMDTPRSARTSP